MISPPLLLSTVSEFIPPVWPVSVTAVSADHYIQQAALSQHTHTHTQTTLTEQGEWGRAPTRRERVWIRASQWSSLSFSLWSETKRWSDGGRFSSLSLQSPPRRPSISLFLSPSLRLIPLSLTTLSLHLSLKFGSISLFKLTDQVFILFFISFPSFLYSFILLFNRKKLSSIFLQAVNLHKMIWWRSPWECIHTLYFSTGYKYRFKSLLSI